MLKRPPTNILQVSKCAVLLFTDYLKGVVCIGFCSVKNLVKTVTQEDTLNPQVVAFKSQKLSIICNWELGGARWLTNSWHWQLETVRQKKKGGGDKMLVSNDQQRAILPSRDRNRPNQQNPVSITCGTSFKTKKKNHLEPCTQAEYPHHLKSSRGGVWELTQDFLPCQENWALPLGYSSVQSTTSRSVLKASPPHPPY